MVLILKKSGVKEYKIVRLSNNGYSGLCRISDIINPEICYDNKINRIQFYRTIIDKMIEEGNEIGNYEMTEVTNTLHDRIIRFFSKAGISIYLIEIKPELFPFN